MFISSIQFLLNQELFLKIQLLINSEIQFLFTTKERIVRGRIVRGRNVRTPSIVVAFIVSLEFNNQSPVESARVQSDAKVSDTDRWRREENHTEQNTAQIVQGSTMDKRKHSEKTRAR